MVKLEQPRFVDSPAITVAGLDQRYLPEQMPHIPEQWKRLQGELQYLTGRVGQDSFGVWYNVRSAPGTPMVYFSAVRIGEFSPLPRMSRAIIPAGRYAVFAHRGHVSEIRKTCDAIGTEWLPKSGKEHFRSEPGAPDFFERYGPGFNPETGLGDIEVWFPIKK